MLNFFEPTPCQFRSIMLYFLIALLLFPITYEKCDTPPTLTSEFSLSNADDSSASIRHHSCITSSLAYSPFHHSPKTTAFNQCHYSFIGPMTQHQRYCNRTARMTHMPGGVGTFTYQSQYSLMTQPYAILHSFSFFEYCLNQFPGKIEMPVLLDENQIEFAFYSCSFVKSWK